LPDDHDIRCILLRRVIAEIGKDGFARIADGHLSAVLTLAQEIVRRRGAVAPEAVAKAKEAGLDDAEIVETIANVAINIFTNYLNIVADTEIDFPIVRAAELATA
jgi:alkylhydroperoxidase family enzyme